MIAESVVASGVKPMEFVALLNAKNVASGISRAIGEGKFNSAVVMLLNGLQKLGVDPVQVFDAVALDSLKGECCRLLKLGAVEQLVSLMETLAGKIRLLLVVD